ncbi:monoheme cytochrome C [Aquimarina sp. 2201CG14-23]|uniref:monoheme cytochrome C n=1 Tax=Aquimarina mycalae TaxID=3040073 RepID=UPI0024780259|nr:monoheme cytochrome C [Aquimarina sp. 2201CG14-23]MDH7445142.1 monoheme cytochrome C [Aquimarina sp. 2201CG14-23]
MDQDNSFQQHAKAIYKLMVMTCVMVGIVLVAGVYLIIDPTLSAIKNTPELSYKMIEGDDTIENGIHLRTGLVEAEGLMEVVNNCTNCHSSQLVIQNRMSKERWIETIRWMQKTQNLWDLGGNEAIIVNYLVSNYPPPKKGRREVLTNIEWYDLQE